MIPKVIHYCWFGNNPKPELIQNCIGSWRKFCPDYELVEWNETNFDVSCIPYVQKAYADKKWAFVSDYARLYVVYTYGGVYLDTDVLLHNSIDDLLQYDCWMASDDVRYLATGLGFGAVKGNSLIGAIMHAYANYEYPSGTNVIRDTKIIEKELPNWYKSDRTQTINNSILLIGLKDYGKYASHLYTYTWASPQEQAKRQLQIENKRSNRLAVRFLWKLKCVARSPCLISYFDKKKGTKSEKTYTFFAYDFLDYGPVYFIKRLLKKMKRAKK